MSSPQAKRLTIPPEIDAEMTPAVRAFVEALIDRIQDLEARLGSNPLNSSRPPSSEHPHAKPDRPKREGPKRKRGGQPGHPRHQRELLATEECQKVLVVKPEACRRCATSLNGSDPEPLRHQVWELPDIKPIVTEHQQHRLPCPCCGETTCASASLPEGVPTGQSGPRLIAFVALLMAYFRQSKRRASMFLEDLLGQPCCPALTVKMQNQTSAALDAPYQELVNALPEEPQAHMDESPTKEANRKAWLWVVVARLYTVFAIFPSRAGTAVGKLLGDAYAGIVHCDRAKMYWQLKQLQWCWAHLKRDFQALIDHPHPQVKRLGHDLMRQVKLMFQHWRDYQSGKISWKAFRCRMAPVRVAVEGLLLRGVFSGNDRLIGMCDELYMHRQWLWTFVDHRGVEPTNNRAERALRHSVIWRKLCFGTQSAQGSRFVERMLTAIETCRLQERDLFAFLTAAVEAHLAKRPAPSLLPTP